MLLFKHGLIGTANGPIQVKDTTITKHHERSSGKDKVLARYHFNEPHYLENELDMLLNEYDGVYVIDTNTKEDITGQKFSICCFTLFIKQPGFLFPPYHCAPICWFQVFDEGNSPEKIAIVQLIHTLELNVKHIIGRKFAIITDHNLGEHDNYNNKKIEFLPGYYLPDYITLIYASADQGNDVINQVIKWCDKKASSIIKNLTKL